MSSANLQLIDHTLHFHFGAGTSRGVLTNKKSYYVRIQTEGKFGLGEAGPLAGLSPDYQEDCLPAYQKTLESLGPIPKEKAGISAYLDQIPFHQPALRFAVESALLDLFATNPGQYFDNSFSRGKRIFPSMASYGWENPILWPPKSNKN